MNRVASCRRHSREKFLFPSHSNLCQGTFLRVIRFLCCCHYYRDLGVAIDGVCIGEWILLATYAHDSEMQAITAPSLISTIHKSPQHPLSLFPTCCVFISHSLATASNSGDSSTSHSQVFSSQPPVHNGTVH
jgi:hypothetical protein